MRKSIITTILAGLVAATSIPLSHAASAPGVGSNSVGTTAGTESGISNEAGISKEAGSIAAGANSAANPSGNSFIVSPPGAGAGFGFARPQR
jgi:hypothetical protein